MGANWSASGSGATRTYSFTPTAAEPGSKSVSAANNAGGSASSNFTVTADSAAPTTTVAVQRRRLPERDVLHERAGLGDAQRQRRGRLGRPEDSLHDGRHGSDAGQRLGLLGRDQHQLHGNGEVPRLRQPGQRGSRRLPGRLARRHASESVADAHRESRQAARSTSRARRSSIARAPAAGRSASPRRPTTRIPA